MSALSWTFFLITLLLLIQVGVLAYHLPSSHNKNIASSSVSSPSSSSSSSASHAFTRSPSSSSSTSTSKSVKPPLSPILYTMQYRPTPLFTRSTRLMMLSSDLIISAVPGGVISSTTSETSSLLFSGHIMSDMFLAAILSIMSDSIAQFTSTPTMLKSYQLLSKTYDMNRTTRFAIFGFLDGAIGHSWYYTLETFIRDTKVIDIIYRILADALVSFFFALSIITNI